MGSITLTMMKGSDSTPQELSSAHQRQWRQLIGEAFPAAAGSHYFDDFPIWDLSRSVTSRRVVGCLDASQQLLGGAGARLVWMRIPQNPKPILGAVIGAVATATQARKQGIASRCMESLLAWCDQQGAEFVALWGSDHAFYAKFGFTLLGKQARIALPTLPAPIQASHRVVRGWSTAIEDALLESRLGSGLELRPEDRAWISQHPHVQWWSLWGPQTLLAYAGVGKGMDLHHFVHEWGVTPNVQVGAIPDVLQHLLGTIAADDPQAQLLAHPRDLPGGVLIEGLALLRLRTDSARRWVDDFWFWGLDSA